MGEEKTIHLGRLSEGFELRLKDGVLIGYTNRTAYRSLSDENTITAVLDIYLVSGKPILQNVYNEDVLNGLESRACRLQEIHDRRLLLRESLVSATRSGPSDIISEVQRELSDLDRDFYHESVAPLSGIPSFKLKLGKWLVMTMASNGVPLYYTDKRPYSKFLFDCLVQTMISSGAFCSDDRVLLDDRVWFANDSLLFTIDSFRRIRMNIPGGVLTAMKWRAEALDEMYEFAERARKAGEGKLADDALELLKKCAGGDADETYAAFVKLRDSQKNPLAAAREADLGELKDKGIPAANRPRPAESVVSPTTRPANKNGGRQG